MNRLERVKVVYPLKQGLKLIFNWPTSSIFKVKVVYPLKQGLKLNGYPKIILDEIFVKVVYPLKQGLKQ